MHGYIQPSQNTNIYTSGVPAFLGVEWARYMRKSLIGCRDSFVLPVTKATFLFKFNKTALYFKEKTYFEYICICDYF